MTTSNAINANSVGIVKYSGAGVFSAISVTQHDLLVGAASNGITSVAPSATSGVPVISQGASADPAFGTAVVAGGGTGATTLTGVLTGNGTSAVTGITPGIDGVLISNHAAGVPSWLANSVTPGYVLTANAGAPPSWQASGGVGPSLISGNGYIFFGTLLLQWGQIVAPPSGATFTFPIPFPTAVFSITLGIRAAGAQSCACSAPTLSSTTVFSQSGGQVIYVMAIGN